MLGFISGAETVILSLLRARWFPYVAIAAVTAAGGIFGYGYHKGVVVTERAYDLVMTKALSDQLERERTQSRKDLAAVVKSKQQVGTIRYGLQNIERPDSDCNSADWLRAYSAAIGIVQAATGRTDGAVGESEATPRTQ